MESIFDTGLALFSPLWLKDHRRIDMFPEKQRISSNLCASAALSYMLHSVNAGLPCAPFCFFIYTYL